MCICREHDLSQRSGISSDSLCGSVFHFCLSHLDDLEAGLARQAADDSLHVVPVFKGLSLVDLAREDPHVSVQARVAELRTGLDAHVEAAAAATANAAAAANAAANTNAANAANAALLMLVMLLVLLMMMVLLLLVMLVMMLLLLLVMMMLLLVLMMMLMLMLLLLLLLLLHRLARIDG